VLANEILILNTLPCYHLITDIRHLISNIYFLANLAFLCALAVMFSAFLDPAVNSE
jgi:hypothetical protein